MTPNPSFCTSPMGGKYGNGFKEHWHFIQTIYFLQGFIMESFQTYSKVEFFKEMNSHHQDSKIGFFLKMLYQISIYLFLSPITKPSYFWCTSVKIADISEFCPNHSACAWLTKAWLKWFLGSYYFWAKIVLCVCVCVSNTFTTQPELPVLKINLNQSSSDFHKTSLSKLNF